MPTPAARGQGTDVQVGSQTEEAGGVVVPDGAGVAGERKTPRVVFSCGACKGSRISVVGLYNHI